LSGSIEQRYMERTRGSGLDETRMKFNDVNNPAFNNNYMTAGEGVGAGAMNFVSGLGSKGEQVAGAIQSSLGATVKGISDGIWGWATGAQSFGDTMRNLASTILQTFLQTIIQIGVQAVISEVLQTNATAAGAGVRTASAAERPWRMAPIKSLRSACTWRVKPPRPALH